MHPAVWKRLSKSERTYAAYSGALDGIDWRIERVAHLTNLDPKELDWYIEAECGWEPHDVGYLHRLVQAAGTLVEREERE